MDGHQRALVPVTSGHSEIAANLERHARHSRGAYADRTEGGLKSCSAIYAAWCAARGLSPLPSSAEQVADFIDSMGRGDRVTVPAKTREGYPFTRILAGSKKPATVRQYVWAIGKMHIAARVPNPCTDGDIVTLALKRLSRAVGRDQRQAAPLNRPAIDRILAAIDTTTLAGLRNAAMVALAYDSMARRSEIVALDVRHVTFANDGTATVLIAKAKNDQEGKGSVRFLAADSAQLVRRWIDAAELFATTPLFRSVNKADRVGPERLSPIDVNRIYRRVAGAAGLDLDRIGGHSTRVGAAQDLTAGGFGTAEVMQAGGWQSAEMVGRYTRHLQARRGAMAKLAALQNRL